MASTSKSTTLESVTEEEEDELMEEGEEAEIETDSQQEYGIEKILDHEIDKLRPGQLEYKIKWEPSEGQQVGDVTWEPENCLTNCDGLLDEYWAAQPEKERLRRLALASDKVYQTEIVLPRVEKLLGKLPPEPERPYHLPGFGYSKDMGGKK